MRSKPTIKAVLLSVCLLFAFSGALCRAAENQLGRDVAELSAALVYNLDNQQMPFLLKPYLKKQTSIMALIITETIDNEVMLTFYRDKNQMVFNQPVPDTVKTYAVQESSIEYEGETVGRVLLYARSPGLSVDLTENEQAWVDNHEVKVGVLQWAPVLYSDTGSDANGIVGDYLKQVVQATGLKIKIVNDQWDVLLQGLKSGDIDILPATYYTRERAGFGLFSTPFLKTPNHLYAREDTHGIRSLSDLKGKKLAIIKGYATVEQVRKKFPDIHIIETRDLTDSVYKVLNKDADAMYESQIAVEHYLDEELVTGLKGVPDNTFQPPSLHFFVRGGTPLLLAIIQKGLDAIPIEEKRKIINKWIPDSRTLALTSAERNWLDTKPVITYTFTPHWKPLEWTGEVGEHTGILADLIKLIQEKSGIRFKALPVPTWEKALETMKTGEVEMLCGAGETDERKTFMSFTRKTLYTTPYVFVSRLGEDFLEGFNDAAGKRIAVPAKSTIQGILNQSMPDLNLIPIDAIDQCFERLLARDIDIIIINAETAKYYKNILGFDKTQITFRTPYTLEVKLAFHREVPKEALSVIDKSIDTIGDKTRSDILHKWITLQVHARTDWMMIVRIGSGLLVVTLFFVWNNRKLKSMVARKTEEITGLLHSFDQNVAASKTDPDGIITYVSDAFCNICGWSRQDLVGNTHRVLRHPDMPKEIFDDLWATITRKETWRGEIKSLKKDGGFYWVEAIITPELDKQSHITGYTAVRQDITAKKAVEELSANLERMVQERTLGLEEAKNKIETLHKYTRDSIQYAALIQSSLTPNNELFLNYFSDYFAIWHPRDIVGGDIYLFDELRNENECLIMVIDCTGHGVPGAFVTMLVKAIERQVVTEIRSRPGIAVSPAWILGYFNRNMKKLLKQEDDSSVSDDGFDGGVLYYNKKDRYAQFAGACTPLFHFRGGELKKIKGDRYSVGYIRSDADYEFKDNRLDLEPGDTLYLTTDGYLDQKGGPKGFGFGKKRFSRIIHDFSEESMADQQEMFLYELAEYQGGEEQRDDITVLGLRI